MTQILKAINNIKYVSKKKPCTLKIFNYLQNNYAGNYDYHSVEVKLNGITEKRDQGPWENPGPRTLWGSRTLWGPRTLGGSRTLRWPRTLGEPRILWGPRALGGPRTLWGPRTLGGLKILWWSSKDPGIYKRGKVSWIPFSFH